MLCAVVSKCSSAVKRNSSVVLLLEGSFTLQELLSFAATLMLLLLLHLVLHLN